MTLTGLVQRGCRTFGFEVRRLHGGVVPQPPPMIAYWLDRVEYVRCRMEQIAHLDGAIVECGVYRGRTLSMFAYWMQRPAHAQRHLFGFDSFRGFPAPTPNDGGNREAHEGNYGDTSPAIVRAFLEASGIPREFMETRCHLIPGFFSETVPNWTPQPIALLHVDCDLYESTMQVLTLLAPQVVPGGVILFDEYEEPRYPGARQAIEEYFGEEVSAIQTDAFRNKHYLVKVGVPAQRSA
ncbi:MAG: class I SAM-dependent methyltransferase [Candidatus Omnitrophica bacterium]|nr:class I SAM-dependent methyltransferase [Candidatus Omnitrophota bacterium]